MKFAIHHSSKYQFSKRWIDYCEANNINYKIVDAYDTDIVNQVKDCDCFLWQFTQSRYDDKLMAKKLLNSLEFTGIKVFPNFKTSWHFDDKLAQKYLLESLEVPFIKSYVFYTKQSAENWLRETTFPKVFKLRGGAGSMNVYLAKNKNQAISLVNKAFGKGFDSLNWKHRFNEEIRKFKISKESIKNLLGLIFILFKKYPNDYSKFSANEKGYAYFQDFMPDNKFDIRVIVIDDKAFAIKRMNRKDDFRASGSGTIIYNKEEINEKCIEIAFEVNEKIQSQCIAYDFVFDSENNPLIIEISYAFSPGPYDKCEGYWDANMNWYKGSFNPYGWIIESLIK